MINEEFIKELVKNGENHFVEFKSGIYCDACFFEDILALCNNETEESYFLIGFKDKIGDIVGIDEAEIKSVTDKIKGNIKRFPRMEFLKQQIDSKTVLCIRIYDKLEAPYFFEKDGTLHECKTKAGKEVGKIKFFSRKSDGNFSDFNTLERLFKKRLGVNLSPLEKIQQIFKRPDFWNEFEDPSDFTEKDFMNEAPLSGFDKERQYYSNQHSVMMLKSDYSFRVRFFVNTLYHFAHTKEEFKFVTAKVKEAREGIDTYCNYLLQPNNFKNYRNYNSFWLNKALALKQQIKDFSCVNPYYFSSSADNHQDYYKRERLKRSNSPSCESDTKLYQQIKNIFSDTQVFEYKEPDFGHDFGLEEFAKYKNYDVSKDSLKKDFQHDDSKQIYYCLDYQDRFLFPNIRNNRIAASCKYFTEITLNNDIFVLPSLETIETQSKYNLSEDLPLEQFQLSCVVKDTNDYKVYHLYCQKFKVQNNIDNFFNVSFFLYVSGIFIFDTTAQKEEFIIKLKSRSTIDSLIKNRKWQKKTGFNKMTQEKHSEIYNKLFAKANKHNQHIINKKFEEQFGKESLDNMRYSIKYAFEGDTPSI